MLKLDRALFSLSLQLVALRIPAKRCSEFMQRLQGHVLYRPRIKPIIPQPDGDNSHRLLLLSEDIKDLELTGLPDPMRAYVQEHEAQPLFHKMDMDYSFFTADQVLRKLLPEGMEVPSSFEQVGHVAHVNLRDEVVPYKNLIGQADASAMAPYIVGKLARTAGERERRHLQARLPRSILELSVSLHDNSDACRISSAALRPKPECLRMIHLCEVSTTKVAYGKSVEPTKFEVHIVLLVGNCTFRARLDYSNGEAIFAWSRRQKAYKQRACRSLDGFRQWFFIYATRRCTQSGERAPARDPDATQE
eukprot:861002-Pleurochrysis_carterae.AAC.3